MLVYVFNKLLCFQLGDFLALCDQKKIGVKEQREIFGNMSSDHQQLRTSYLRAKDEHRNFSEAGSIFYYSF